MLTSQIHLQCKLNDAHKFPRQATPHAPDHEKAATLLVAFDGRPVQPSLRLRLQQINLCGHFCTEPDDTLGLRSNGRLGSSEFSGTFYTGTRIREIRINRR